MNTINDINRKIETAKELDFGTIFNDAIELFKKTWVHGLLAQVFIMLIMLPFIIVIYVPLISMVIAQEQGGFDSNGMESIFAGMSIAYMLFFFVAMIALSAVAGAIGAGLYRVIKMVDHGETVVTKDLFYFVKGKYLGKYLGLMLISIIIAIPAALLCYIPLLYAMVPLSLFVVFFAFNTNLPTMDIVKSSFKLGNKKWLLLFGLIFISSLLAQIVGLLACGIGVFVTAPFVYHPVYLVYKKVIGFGDDDPIKEIGQAEA